MNWVWHILYAMVQGVSLGIGFVLGQHMVARLGELLARRKGGK